MKLPATLKPEEITAVSDQQEEIPFDLSPLQTVRAHLTTGDYSVVGLEHVISIERKSLTDLLKCVARMLLISARRRWREARGFAATVKGGE